MMCKRSYLVLAYPVLALTLLLPSGVAHPARGQSAQEVFQTALERHRAATEGIQSYTVVQEVMGVESTLTYERQTVDGQTVFVPAGDQSGAGGWSSLPSTYDELAQRATLEGEEAVDGEACWVAVVEDFEGLDLQAGVEGQMEGEFTPRKGVFFIDQDDYLLRKLILEGDVSTGQGTSPFTMESVMGDYRTVEGWDYPFRVEMTARGVPTGMSEEEAAEARQQLETMRSQLESMPEAQRKMAEGMMKGQLERLEKMLESGVVEAVIITKELTVNR